HSSICGKSETENRFAVDLTLPKHCPLSSIVIKSSGAAHMKRKTAHHRNNMTRRRFVVEGLEPRCLLAGNVNVFLPGGSLFVQGDANDNAVLIQQEGDGVYSVTGLDFADINTDGLNVNDGPTSINGDDSGDPVLFSGVKNDINVDLKGGNDGLAIGND